jgi:hypothetical protein
VTGRREPPLWQIAGDEPPAPPGCAAIVALIAFGLAAVAAAVACGVGLALWLG